MQDQAAGHHVGVRQLRLLDGSHHRVERHPCRQHPRYDLMRLRQWVDKRELAALIAVEEVAP